MHFCFINPSIYQILPSVLPQLVFPKIGQRLHSMQVRIHDLQILQVIKRKDQSLFILNTKHPAQNITQYEKNLVERTAKVKYIY